MPAKRKAPQLQPSIADTGSRFTECPGCGRQVAKAFLNDHLDRTCPSLSGGGSGASGGLSPHLQTQLVRSPPAPQQQQPLQEAVPAVAPPAAPASEPGAAPAAAEAEAEVIELCSSDEDDRLAAASGAAPRAGSGGGGSGAPGEPIVAHRPSHSESSSGPPPPPRRPDKRPAVSSSPAGGCGDGGWGAGAIAAGSSSGDQGTATAAATPSPWWTHPGRRAAGGERIVATLTKVDGARVGLTQQLLHAVTGCCELVPSPLPPELVEQLLETLLPQTRYWEHQTWWMGERKGTSAKASCCYLLAEGEHALPPAGSDTGRQEEQQNGGGGGYGAGDVQVPPVLEVAADLVAESVNQRIIARAGTRSACLLEASDAGGCWVPSYALANLYRDGSAGVGAHSDRLTSLGPRPIVASLSLGATRTFRLLPTQRLAFLAQNLDVEQEAGSSAGHALAAEAAELSWQVASIDVPLHHGALLILWPPCMECWKHQITTTSSPLQRHPTAGTTRINLTLRRCKPAWQAHAPLCHCGLRCQMKVQAPKAAGGGVPTAHELRYSYRCDNMAGPPCQFYQAARSATWQPPPGGSCG